MAVNEFLPFATEAGANVLAQEVYEDLVARKTGFQSGTAKSIEVNKSIRQGAVMAAAIGEFIKVNGIDALDDGDVPTLAGAFLDALKAQTKYESSLLVVPTVPALHLSSTIYVEDREQILRWKTIGAFTGYVSPEVGCLSYGTQPDPRPFEVDLIGQTLDKTNPKYAALYAWANAMGRFVAAGSWTAGTYFFCEMGGNLFRVPDLRNMFIRFTGTDIDTANARALGTKQLDALQNIIGGVSSVLVNSSFAMNGAFAGTKNINAAVPLPGTDIGTGALTFDASRVARASGETRAINTALHPRILL